LREVTELVLSRDPLEPRLRAADRGRRLLSSLHQAAQRLDSCLGAPLTGAKESLDALRREIRDVETAFEGRPPQQIGDLAADGVDLVYRAERAAEQHCTAEPTPFDRALVLIGRRHGFEEQ
jgi:hypothetical protein